MFFDNLDEVLEKEPEELSAADLDLVEAVLKEKDAPPFYLAALHMLRAIMADEEARIVVDPAVKRIMAENVERFCEVEECTTARPYTYVCVSYELPTHTAVGYGFAKCMASDKFSRAKGVEIAKRRAARQIVNDVVCSFSGEYIIHDDWGKEAFLGVVASFLQILNADGKNNFKLTTQSVFTVQLNKDEG